MRVCDIRVCVYVYMYVCVFVYIISMLMFLAYFYPFSSRKDFNKVYNQRCRNKIRQGPGIWGVCVDSCILTIMIARAVQILLGVA